MEMVVGEGRVAAEAALVVVVVEDCVAEEKEDCCKGRGAASEASTEKGWTMYEDFMYELIVTLR
jgi:hypothetical protein